MITLPPDNSPYSKYISTRDFTDFPPEVHEIIAYLAAADFSYAIFAGFGSYLRVHTETSNDVDVFVASSQDCQRIRQQLEPKGWLFSKEESESEDHYNLVLSKNGCEFDLVYSKNAAANLLSAVSEVKFGNYQVLVLIPEAMLLTKINQATHPLRSSAKISRDVATISLLRQQINLHALQQLASKMDLRYWGLGRM